MEKDYVLGIDFGTTNTVVSYYEKDGAEILINDFGERVTPTAIAFDEDFLAVIGNTALNQAASNKNTVLNFKRDIGSDKIYEINNARLTPRDLVTIMMEHIKANAKKVLGQDVKQSVVTVPAYFTTHQKEIVKEAAEAAGLEVIRIINEPTAAAIAYKLDDSKQSKNVVVYDLGGGTFDVSVLTVERGVFDVLATGGNTRLGGLDFDSVIFDYIEADFKRQHDIDLPDDMLVRSNVMRAAETAKKELSSLASAHINLPFIAQKDGIPVSYSGSISRAVYESLIKSLLNETFDEVRRVVEQSDLDFDEIDDVVLVGGSTLTPAVKEGLREVFPKALIKEDLNPREIVSEGAAIFGRQLVSKDQDILLLDVIPLTMGVALDNGFLKPLIDANTKIPVIAKEIFTTSQDFQDNILVEVYQGERPRAVDNILLGDLVLDDLPPLKKGRVKIEVKFIIDKDGVLSVTVKDLESKREVSKVIKNRDVKQSDIDRIVREAKHYEKEDDAFKFSYVEKPEYINFVESALNYKDSLSLDLQEKLEELDFLLDMPDLNEDAAAARKLYQEVSRRFDEEYQSIVEIEENDFADVRDNEFANLETMVDRMERD